MNRDNGTKTTILGVVIFSAVGLLVTLLIAGILGGISALLVLKTPLPEGFIKVGCVIGAGIGTVVGTAFLTAVARLRGIVGAGIIWGMVLCVKVLGNCVMHLGGYFTLNGLIGIVFLAFFAVCGGVIGAMLKRG